MVFVPAANTVEVFMEHEYNGKPGVGWVLHYRGALGAWTFPMLEDLATQLVTWWGSEIAPAVVPSLLLQRVRLRDLTTQSGQIYDRTAGLPIGGSGSGTPSPSNVSFSLKKNTGLAGKSNRGRVYLMGMSENVTTGNMVSSSWANQLVAAFNEAIILVGTEDTYAMALVSKFSGGAPRVNAEVQNVVSFTYADLVVDTRRDRL